MNTWGGTLLRFVEEEEGPTAVEYAVMLALIIMVCFIAISALGTKANESFSNPELGNTLSGGT